MPQTANQGFAGRSKSSSRLTGMASKIPGVLPALLTVQGASALGGVSVGLVAPNEFEVGLNTETRASRHRHISGMFLDLRLDI